MFESCLGSHTGGRFRESGTARFHYRAAQADVPSFKPGLTKRAYNVSYRRLSAAVHADYRAFDLVLNATDALPMLEAQDKAAAATILLMSASNCLGILEYLWPMGAELFKLAKESQRRPKD